MYLGIGIYVLVSSIDMYVKGLDVWWCPGWPFVCYFMFLVTRIIERTCFNVKFYIIVVVPINIFLFGVGIMTFFYCRKCLNNSLVIFLTVFSLQCIQMLIFVCMLTILIIDMFSYRNRGNNDIVFNDRRESFLERGLTEEEIATLLSNKPANIESDETCSICLCELTQKSINPSEKVEECMQFRTCVFHCVCIKDWLSRDSRCPNCNTDVRNSL